MFEGEKTSLFWAGLIILCIASLFLFQTIWSMRLSVAYGVSDYIVNMVPMFVGTVIFILIGSYMMKSGLKKASPLKPS